MTVEPDLWVCLWRRWVARRGVVGLPRVTQGGLAHRGLPHRGLAHRGLAHGWLAHGLLPGQGLGRVGEVLAPWLPRHHRHDGRVLGEGG